MSPEIQSHIGLFIFRPSYAVNEMKYKINTYLENTLIKSLVICIHG